MVLTPSNLPNCTRTESMSSSSAQARWDMRPVIRISGMLRIRSSTLRAFPSSQPSRPIPVSNLKWTAAGAAWRDASRTSRAIPSAWATS